MKDQIDPSSKPSINQTTFFATPNVKRVLICLHGFETAKTHDMTAFKDYFDKNNTNPNFSVVLVNLYEYGDKKTYRSKLMYKKAYDVVKKYIEEGYVVYLLAYSFSVGIAAKCCVDFPSVQKLALISPTIYIYRTKLLGGYTQMLIKRLKIKAKYRKKAKKVFTKDHSRGMFKLTCNIAKSILEYRKYLKKLTCKVLMIKGNQDELSISNTFSYISSKSKDSITASKIYPNENHVMFLTLEHGKRAFNDVLMFIFHMDLADKEEEKNDIRY